MPFLGVPEAYVLASFALGELRHNSLPLFQRAVLTPRFAFRAYYGTIPPDIATNIALLILPIPVLWNLQMKPAR